MGKAGRYLPAVILLFDALLVQVPSSRAQIGEIEQYKIQTSNSAANRITMGPEGSLWFTEGGGGGNPPPKIGRVCTAASEGCSRGSIPHEFALSMSCHDEPVYPDSITWGPDGNLWFTEGCGIHSMTPKGEIKETYMLPDNIIPFGITTGPRTSANRSLWFTGNKPSSKTPGLYTGVVGYLLPEEGIQKIYDVPSPGTSYNQMYDITLGSDGDLWFVFQYASAGFGKTAVAHLNPDTGKFSSLITLPGPSGRNPNHVTRALGQKY